MNPNKIRETVLKAIFSNDQLMDILTLKGGNAMKILQLTTRESQDLDFSIREGIRLDKETYAPIFEECIEKEFSAYDIRLLNFKFEHKPLKKNKFTPPFWGGYIITFSIITNEEYNKLSPNHLKNPAQFAMNVTPNTEHKKVILELSFDEYTDQREEVLLDDVTIYVYSPLMIVYEKIRASCQQLPDYKIGSPKKRARDLYDIHTILTNKNNIHLKENLFEQKNLTVLIKMFELKNVPLSLILKLNTIYDELNKDYQDNVIPTISSEKSIPSFEYIFEYNQEFFREIYSQLQQ